MMRARGGDVLRSLAFYGLFYGGSLCLALLSAPLPVLGPRWAVTLAHCWTRWQRWLVRHVLRIEVRIEGTVPRGGVLVAGKHESMFEAIDLPCLLHMPVPFAKVELLQLPLWGRVGREYGVVPVERDKGAKALRAMLAAASHYAKAGRPLAIFPEGTRV
ncbi:MAG: lysophospholipid acyltransferase family protein, partial [Novosphingobium sp.]